MLQSPSADGGRVYFPPWTWRCAYGYQVREASQRSHGIGTLGKHDKGNSHVPRSIFFTCPQPNLRSAMCVQNSSTSSSREESPLTECDYPEIVNLWLKLSTDTEWIAILAIPTEEFDRFAFRPLSWLRFLGFAVYGREGVLLLSENGPEVSDYTGSVDSLQNAYYYSSQGKRNSPAIGIQLITLSADDPQLVDTQGINDRVSDLYSNANESHAEFAGAITERDERCVMSGRVRLFCDAAHLIPRSKGDEVRFC